MAKMHDNELEIHDQLVRSLLRNQCSQWADLPLSQIRSCGTDNALFRLGSDYIVRLPRVEWEPGSNVIKINKEYEWLPKIANYLKTSISFPVFKGDPDNQYPYPWLIAKWYEGNVPVFEKEDEYKLLAEDLAHFLNDLHHINLPGGPISRRGIRLNDYKLDTETRNAISQLEGEIDIPRITSSWDQLSAIPYWDNPPVWIHGDFLPGNILIQNNRLTAVLDFTDVGMGDPACDLVIAWALLNSTSRQIFKSKLENIDSNTWERGRGWALSIALIMLPYYKNTNPVLATLARHMINTTTDSE